MDPDHDQIYLRFLFRLGDKKSPNQSLYESFESLLEELGIQIEIDPGDEGVQEITRGLSVGERPEYETTVRSDKGSGTRKSTRRASFHSLYDAENDSITANKSRAPSSASSSRPIIDQKLPPEKRPATRASTRPTERTPQRPLRSQVSALHPGRGRLTAQAFASNLQHYQRRNASTSDIRGNNSRKDFLPWDPSERLIAQPRGLNSKGQPSSIAEQFAGEANRNGSWDIVGIEDKEVPYVVDRRENPYRFSETQQMRDVQTFEYYRIKAVARRALYKWYSTARQAEEHHRMMEMTAINRDTEVLVHQAFEHWFMRFRIQRKIAETERFFLRLEQQAIKARNLFLLTKAFTHWAECTHEEVLRSSEARRQILSLKCFKAWREITAVNELKVRRQGLRKFFRVWKQRCVQNLIDEATAITFHHNGLRKTAYWYWFWKFCETRAPEWRTVQLKTKCFAGWVIKLRKISEREEQVSSCLRRKVKRHWFGQWLTKAQLITECAQVAAEFNRQKLTAQFYREWKLRLQFGPLAQQVSNMVDWRVAGTTFATFIYRFRVERHAEEVNHRRNLRNTWVQWNDRLRCQTLARQIDDRFVLETLYKWVIAERAVLLQRLHTQRSKQKVLMKISVHFYAIRAQRNRTCQAFERERNLKSFSFHFELWRQRLYSCQQDEHTALAFHNPRIAQEALQVWNTKHTHIQKLGAWAKDARFYFLARKSLKRWRAAVIESKRRKYRDAYAQIRRRVKMDLARNVISRWRGLTSQITELNNEARVFNQENLLRAGSNLYDQWRTRWEFIVDRTQETNEFYQQKVLSRYFQSWLDQKRTIQERHVRAQRLSDIRLGRLALESLHKLRLEMIEHQGRSRKAESLRVLHERRHIHTLLRTWHTKTASRAGFPPRDMPFSSRPSRFAPRPDLEEDPINRAEEWTTFENGFDLREWIPALEAQASATPMPGHLSTPSKRAARARALVGGVPLKTPMGGVSSTPAGTPALTIAKTPFQRRRRDVERVGRSTLRREVRGHGKSVFGAATETEPVGQDKEPRTPDGRGALEEMDQ